MHDRRLYDSDKKLFEYLSELEVVGTYELEIKKGQGKRTPRIAKMEVRSGSVKLARASNCSKECPDFVEVYVIEARESSETIPKSEDGILWRIITTHEVINLEQALQVIHW
jgi:hypothetical protein